MMKLHDAHNHLQDERFGGRQEQLVREANDAGVARMVVNGSCEEDWPAVAELARRLPQVLASFGYHPWYLSERTPDWQTQLVQFLDGTPSVIGEIGLDRWKPDLPYEGQEDAFVWQLRLAAERNLAASLHCLKAWGRLHELLRENPRPARGFLLHSYGGSREMVEPLARLGAFFSFPGYFMHERKQRQREVFAAVPLDLLLIETDAPDQLLPESETGFPLTDAGGKPLNHPANLVRVYEFVAAQRGMRVEALADQLAENFQRLFGS
jgi:TatD DNase family protein